MDDVIYGVIDRANTVARENAPPERISMYPSRLPLPVTIACSAVESRNGTGTAEPTLNRIRISSV